MRWNDTVTLLSAKGSAYQDSAGAWHEGKRTGRTVRCNPWSAGLSSQSAALALGLRTSASVRVRSLDYQGEDRCEYHGEELDVLSASGGNGMVTLMLGRRVGNG